ncbi:MAG: TIM barrel protein, partial [Pseudomonadota bacterium]
FDAVECHWPYDTPTAEVNTALSETGLIMLGLNTARGSNRDNGLAAVPGREEEAHQVIAQAIEYAAATKTPNVHVMAGFAQGREAHETFIENLHYACQKALPHNITILIEPLNHYDAPNYFLKTSAQAKAIIEQTNAPNLKLMFDCYHIQIMEGDISRRLEALLPIIGHIQFASVPDRAEPHQGELDYRHVFGLLEDIGFKAPLGAEYRPATTTDEGLGWMEILR